MAKRGRRPTPAHLRLIQGTHRDDRHGEPPKSAPPIVNGLTMPSYLKGEAAKAWRQWIAPAAWLDIYRMAAAVAFCELWAEFRREPRSFVAAKHSQMRGYRSDLGLTDDRPRPPSHVPDDDEFFA